MSNSLQTHGLYSPWNSPGQNTGVGSLYLLQGFFPTQGSNPSLLHHRQILYQLSHKKSPLSHRLSGLKQQTSVLSSEIQNGSHWVKSSLPLGKCNGGYNFLHLSTSKGCQNSLSCGPCPSLNPDWPVNTFSCCIIPISAAIVMSLTLTDSSTFLFHIERRL